METRTVLSTIQTGVLEEDIVVESDDDVEDHASDETSAARDADAVVRAIADATNEKKPPATREARASRRFGFDALERRAD